jgi:hypothetical protein
VDTGAWYALFQNEAGKLRWLIGKEPSAGREAEGKKGKEERVTAAKHERRPYPHRPESRMLGARKWRERRGVGRTRSLSPWACAFLRGCCR